MNKREADKLIETIRSFVESDNGGKVAAAPAGPGASPAPARAELQPAARNGAAPFDEEALYQRFRARFIDEARIDPTLVHLMMTQPEIIVGYERRIEQLDGSTLRGRVARLIAAGYLKDGKATGTIRKELARTGADPGGGGTLAGTLADLVRQGFLERHEDGWSAAPGVKITERQIETTT